jgi:hypothetical protein
VNIANSGMGAVMMLDPLPVVEALAPVPHSVQIPRDRPPS